MICAARAIRIERGPDRAGVDHGVDHGIEKAAVAVLGGYAA
jgi:hypothetical protein